MRRSDEAVSWREALEYCLGRVPRRGRKVLEARFVDDPSYKEFDVSLDLGEFGFDTSLDHMKSGGGDKLQ